MNLKYLINNTKFETPGRGRYKYGKLYNENGQTFMKLCLQIRFKMTFSIKMGRNQKQISYNMSRARSKEIPL